MNQICCVTGYSFFDVWTLAHLSFWIFIGSSLWGLKAGKWLAVGVGLALALVWEAFEYFVAYKLWPDRWLDPESWGNSLVSDPLTCIVGVLGIWFLLDTRPRKVRK